MLINVWFLKLSTVLPVSPLLPRLWVNEVWLPFSETAPGYKWAGTPSRLTWKVSRCTQHHLRWNPCNTNEDFNKEHLYLINRDKFYFDARSGSCSGQKGDLSCAKAPAIKSFMLELLLWHQKCAVKMDDRLRTVLCLKISTLKCEGCNEGAGPLICNISKSTHLSKYLMMALSCFPLFLPWYSAVT